MKTKLLSFKYLIGVVVLMIFATAFLPVDNSNSIIKVRSITYTEEVESFMILPKGSSNQLHDFEKLDLTPVTETFQVTRTLNSANEMNEERIWLASSKEVKAYESQTGRFVSDEKGVCLFDKQGRLLVEEPLSEEALSHRNALAKDIGKNGFQFPHVITEEDIAHANEAENDRTIINLEGGNIGVLELMVDEKLNYKVFTVFQKVGENQYIPIRKTEINATTTFYSGTCVEEVTQTSFANYQVNGKPLSERK